jgi:hemicentin
MVDFKLIVLEPPRILMLDSDKSKRPINGSTVLLYCPAQGKPDPTIVWHKDGASFASGDNDVEIINNGASVRIGSSRVEHSGRFTCIAKNKAGEADQDVTVYVMSKRTC